MSYKYGEIIKLLKEVIEILNIYDTDLSYTKYNTVEEVIQELNLLIVRLDKENQDVYKKLKVLFAPTGEFQEISINSGWTNEYLEIAYKLDMLL